jgi:uncharacterized membrane protein YphA (DoxX/SURF4 family)
MSRPFSQWCILGVLDWCCAYRSLGAFLIGRQTKLAGLLLAIFLIIIVLSIHLPAIINAPDEMASRVPLSNLIKDTGLAGGALMIAGKGN